MKKTPKTPAITTPIRPQNEDVWSRTQTINGFAVDELRSVLQKSIRRGLIDEATLAAYELYVTGPEAEELLWRRLEIIATEDVGFGMITAPMLLFALNEQRKAIPHGFDRWIYSAHAVRVLCTAKKDRTSTDLAAWAETVVERGEKMVEVLDYQIDHHTQRGTKMGRGPEFWRATGGGQLDNQMEGLETRWSNYLTKIREAEDKKKAAKQNKAKRSS